MIAATGPGRDRLGRESDQAGLDGTLLEAIFEQTEVGMTVVDRDLRFVRVNRAFGMFQHRDPSMIVGRTISEALPQLASQIEQVILEVFATGEPIVGQEVMARDRDDPASLRWFRVNRYPIFSIDRNVDAVISIFVEVTDLRNAQIRLDDALVRVEDDHLSELATKRAQLEALGRYRTIFEGASIGILRVEANGRMVEANPAMERMLGYTAAELAEMDFSRYTHPDDVEYNRVLFKEMMAGERDSFQLEKRCYRKDGDLVWVQVTAALERDEQGNPKFAISMLENVTQRRAAEDQLRQSQKIEAIGQLTAGIAHDFNNLLLGMVGYTELARAEIADGPAADYLGRVESCAQRATTLTGQLLAFGRRQALHPRPLELNELVSETVAMLRSVLGERIELVTVLDPALDTIRADSGQMQQVLLNLALNARDAMADGGTLTIRTSNADVGPETSGLPLRGELEPGRYIVLSVEDEGCGITPAVLDRIFDPFFTTKSVGKGTGLGLSSAYGIIKQSGGHIEVTSEPGHGSTFDSYLPALPTAPAPEESAPQPLPSEAPKGAGRRILVVEDEEVVRALLARTLERLGYTVETAEDPSVALPMLRMRGEEFALVISDMVMPHMTGAEFAREVAAWKPELPFVFVSGYTEDVGAVDGRLFLQKPFTSEALATTIREALTRSA